MPAFSINPFDGRSRDSPKAPGLDIFARCQRRFRRRWLGGSHPWLRIMTTALRYLWRPQAECEARKIAPRRA
ncbi:TPA: hypothetical protein L5749_32735, partial [Pseudomonas aeruginosa]|nr:hypothetical protein [Pseudomonas aeruginosa]